MQLIECFKVSVLERSFNTVLERSEIKAPFHNTFLRAEFELSCDGLSDSTMAFTCLILAHQTRRLGSIRLKKEMYNMGTNLRLCRTETVQMHSKRNSNDACRKRLYIKNDKQQGAMSSCESHEVMNKFLLSIKDPSSTSHSEE